MIASRAESRTVRHGYYCAEHPSQHVQVLRHDTRTTTGIQKSQSIGVLVYWCRLCLINNKMNNDDVSLIWLFAVTFSKLMHGKL